jgi:tRNA threonylcarbamoyladenosine biosynthesis protein TsaE
MSDVIFETRSAAETRSLGRRIAALLRPGDVVLLNGDLGAGKTTMVQGIGMALGTRERAQSPTFSLVIDTPLADGVLLRHIDLYRLDDPAELEALGFEDLISDDSAITFIEWPERAIELLPDRYLLIDLQVAGPDLRTIAIRPVGMDDRFEDLTSGS